MRVSYRDGPWMPVALRIGSATFWVVQNSHGDRLAETEENASAIADGLNAAMENATHSTIQPETAGQFYRRITGA